MIYLSTILTKAKYSYLMWWWWRGGGRGRESREEVVRMSVGGRVGGRSGEANIRGSQGIRRRGRGENVGAPHRVQRGYWGRRLIVLQQNTSSATDFVPESPEGKRESTSADCEIIAKLFQLYCGLKRHPNNVAERSYKPQ